MSNPSSEMTGIPRETRTFCIEKSEVATQTETWVVTIYVFTTSVLMSKCWSTFSGV